MAGTASRTHHPGRRFGLYVGAVLLLSAGTLTPRGGALAQIKVEGEVLDALTGVPVGGVIVHFPDLGLGTISDEMGYFAFDAVARGPGS